MDGLDKYQAGGKIIDQVMGALLQSLVPGTNIGTLCKQSDEMLTNLLATVYAKGKTKCDKGIAYPTCICPNNVAGHYSPDEADADSIEQGMVVKIDLGVQIGGFVSQGAITAIVVAEGELVTGPVADAVSAAHYCGEAILRMLRPGTKGSDMTKTIATICEAYGVTPVGGVLSHEVKQFIMFGSNCWANKANKDEKLEDFEVEANTAWNVDILISTGAGEPTAKTGEEATIFVRDLQSTKKDLRVTSARQVLGEIDRKYPTFPFAARSLEHAQAAFGMKQCEREGAIQAFPTLRCTEDETVVQVKFTAAITGSNTVRMNQGYTPYVQSEKAIEDADVLNILKKSTKRRNKK